MAGRKGKDEVAATNGRAPAADVEAIEREHVEQLARAHAALAEAQDRSYWLDRWGLDLNAQMRKPGARRLRGLLRGLRELRRAELALRRYVNTRLGDLRTSAAEDEIAAASGVRRQTEPAAPSAGDDPTAAQD
jgi:hypothetical protein